MSTWKVTEADRDAAGRVWTTPPSERRLADLLPAPASSVAAASAGPTVPARPWRFGRVELAAVMGGLVVALILIALITRVAPAQDGPRAPVRPLATLSTLPTGAARPTLASTLPPAAGAVMVVAWAAPNGLVLGPIPLPLTATARFDQDWIGVPWQGGTVWVRAHDWPNAVIAALPNLAPPTAAPAPMVIDDAATAPPPRRVQEQPSDKPGPHDGASKTTPAQQPRVVPTSRPTPLTCWAGPPMVLRPGQQACWRGVPFVMPAQP